MAGVIGAVRACGKSFMVSCGTGADTASGWITSLLSENTPVPFAGTGGFAGVGLFGIILPLD
jgi:hypothetical protein